MKTFADETNSLNQYVASLGLSAGSANTQSELKLVRDAEQMAARLEKNYVLPSYSILKQLNDSIYLFAHDIDSMFVYDRQWNLVRNNRIHYHHLKSWGKELIVNEERTKIYAKMTEFSKPMIVEIDLLKGSLKQKGTTVNTRFPSKIKIRNNTIYFMTKQKSGTGNTVYAQDLYTN